LFSVEEVAYWVKLGKVVIIYVIIVAYIHVIQALSKVLSSSINTSKSDNNSAKYVSVICDLPHEIDIDTLRT